MSDKKNQVIDGVGNLELASVSSLGGA